MTEKPVIWWVRRDLRLTDNPALVAATETGAPVIPVFILDPETEAQGAAPLWRLGLGLGAFDKALRGLGSRIVFRKGDALAVLRDLIAETGARAVHWTRAYDPIAQQRDTAVKSALSDAGVTAASHAGHLLFEPWTVETGTGGFYRVYTPFWKAVRSRDVAPALPAPRRIAPPDVWPDGPALEDLAMGARMRRGAAIVGQHARPGEGHALTKLDLFLDGPSRDYARARDIPGVSGTSRLSEHLTYGEISPRTVWHRAMYALHDGDPGAETFLREIAWREFSYHLLHHTPHITTRSWREEFDAFPWRGDTPDAERWRQGRTGVPIVDAAMRELYVTGTVHNRARMIAGSYLTKHLLTHWKVGLDWFAECLIDWDPAANAMGWQWVAGSGPDASPYFRVFNPETQAEKFDRNAAYRHRFVAELSPDPGQEALDFFRAVPRSWNLNPGQPYLDPVISLAEGRARALDAYAGRPKRPA